MPIFDTLVLGADKYSAVFEFGHSYTKCGFAHEYSPRVFIKSEVFCKSKHKVLNLFDIKEEEVLYDGLKRFIEKLYFGYLAINPKDRKVIIAESIFCTLLFQKMLLKVFYEYFNVPSVVVVPQHLVAMMTLQISTGIVLDIGHLEAICVPVINGVTLLQESKFAPLAGKAINERVLENMIEYQAKIKVKSEERLFDFNDLTDKNILEEIKVKLCFVCPFKRTQAILQEGYENQSKKPADVQLPIDGGRTLTVPGPVLERSCEILFESQLEELNVPRLLLDIILECPIDSRLSLMGNIVLLGGTSMFPGFKHRLQQELIQLVKTDSKYRSSIHSIKFKFHELPCKENYASWLGASILGATDAVNERGTNREQYDKLKNVLINDWFHWWPERVISR